LLAKVKEKIMVKKGLVVLVLAVIAASGAFAQVGDGTMTISLDVAPLFTGFIASDGTKGIESFYFALSPVFEYTIGNYSFGGRMDLVFGSYTKKSVTYFGLTAIGRWYPLTPLEKLYLSTELGFNTCSMEDADDALYTGLTFALRTGWKHYIDLIFLEPSLGYVVSKTNGYMPVASSGWEIGLNIGFAF
jgi:hypothetical protein